LEKVREQLQVRKERAVLVGVNLRGGTGHTINNLTELTALAETAGAIIVDRFQQKISRITPGTYIGKGKAELLRGRVVRFGADVVIFDNDRSELILDIFATRARTRQAKLQVELAQLQYTYPRLTRMWAHLDTVAAAGGAGAAGAVGGIGTRGTGEKQLEIDRRLVNKRITELKRQLAGIDKRKLREIAARKDMFKICLVGYTNAGKSTLMNALTGAGVFVEDRLFATLDTRTRKWVVQAGAEVLLSDTVGFVNHLPHHLVASFKATLEEAVNADLLLHVVDASTEEVFEQIASVKKVLTEIGCGEKDTVLLLNKSDVIRSMNVLEAAQTVHPDAICISARTGMNLDKVARAVLDRYQGGQVLVHVTGSAADGRIHSFLRAHGRIIGEQYSGASVRFEARLGNHSKSSRNNPGPGSAYRLAVLQKVLVSYRKGAAMSRTLLSVVCVLVVTFNAWGYDRLTGRSFASRSEVIARNGVRVRRSSHVTVSPQRVSRWRPRLPWISSSRAAMPSMRRSRLTRCFAWSSRSVAASAEICLRLYGMPPHRSSTASTQAAGRRIRSRWSTSRKRGWSIYLHSGLCRFRCRDVSMAGSSCTGGSANCP